MDFAGKYHIFADRQRVWAALNDAEILQKTIPGCQNIHFRAQNQLEIAIKVNLGIVHPLFIGDLELKDISPAVSYVLSGRGRGRLLGNARGEARVSLTDIEAGTGSTTDYDTCLQFSAEGGASKQLLALGKPLIGKSAQRIIDGFFTRFADAMQVNIEILPADPENSAVPGNDHHIT